MERLSLEDLQAIVTGVADNRELISGIVSQLRDALQAPHRSRASRRQQT